MTASATFIETWCPVKETLAQVFFCEFCKISGNAFSYETPKRSNNSVLD